VLAARRTRKLQVFVPEAKTFVGKDDLRMLINDFLK